MPFSLTHDQISKLVEWRLSREAFVRECLGAVPDPIQIQVMRALDTEEKVAWRSSHGAGKSTVSAWMVLHALICLGPCKVPTTASSWRQLEKFLWPEIHQWRKKMNLEPVGLQDLEIKALDFSIKVEDGWEAFAVATDNPELIEGCHAKWVFYVFDESKSIPKQIWVAAKGAMTGKGQILAVSTPPDSGEGYFCDIFEGKFQGWKTFHSSAFDSPRISQKWIEEMKVELGEDSPEYAARVLGEIPKKGGVDTVIPMAWVESAMSRNDPDVIDTNNDITAALDVSRFGDDETVLALRQGDHIFRLDTWKGYATTTTEDRVKDILSRYKLKRLDVDEGGVGAGVLDHLKRDRLPVVPFNFGGSSSKPDLYADAGTEAWYTLRALLDPGDHSEISLPRDSILKRQLTTRRFLWGKKGKQLVSKAVMKAKYKAESPDRADAVVMLFSSMVKVKGETKHAVSPRILGMRRLESAKLGSLYANAVRILNKRDLYSGRMNIE